MLKPFQINQLDSVLVIPFESIEDLDDLRNAVRAFEAAVAGSVSEDNIKQFQELDIWSTINELRVLINSPARQDFLKKRGYPPVAREVVAEYIKKKINERIDTLNKSIADIEAEKEVDRNKLSALKPDELYKYFKLRVALNPGIALRILEIPGLRKKMPDDVYDDIVKLLKHFPKSQHLNRELSRLATQSELDVKSLAEEGNFEIYKYFKRRLHRNPDLCVELLATQELRKRLNAQLSDDIKILVDENPRLLPYLVSKGTRLLPRFCASDLLDLCILSADTNADSCARMLAIPEVRNILGNDNFRRLIAVPAILKCLLDKDMAILAAFPVEDQNLIRNQVNPNQIRPRGAVFLPRDENAERASEMAEWENKSRREQGNDRLPIQTFRRVNEAREESPGVAYFEGPNEEARKRGAEARFVMTSLTTFGSPGRMVQPSLDSRRVTIISADALPQLAQQTGLRIEYLRELFQHPENGHFARIYKLASLINSRMTLETVMSLTDQEVNNLHSCMYLLGKGFTLQEIMGLSEDHRQKFSFCKTLIADGLMSVHRVRALEPDQLEFIKIHLDMRSQDLVRALDEFIRSNQVRRP